MSCAQIHLRGRIPDGRCIPQCSQRREGQWLTKSVLAGISGSWQTCGEMGFSPLVSPLEPKHVCQRKYRQRDGNGYKVSLPFKIENTGALQITDTLVSAAYSTAEPWCCQVSLFLSLHPPSLSPPPLSLSVFYLSSIYHLSI